MGRTAGFLIIYYMGVLKVLQQLGLTGPGIRVKAAGASSGALTAAVVCSGMPAERLTAQVRAPAAPR